MKRRKPDLAERIYRRLFVLKHRGRRMAMTVVMWPDPRPGILAAIREEIAKEKS